ncbi:MAG: hypothetical protein Q4G34_04855 [Micrococcus sp.]|nr:hypothetical protein [Micrococcus sp.]
MTSGAAPRGTRWLPRPVRWGLWALIALTMGVLLLLQMPVATPEALTALILAGCCLLMTYSPWGGSLALIAAVSVLTLANYGEPSMVGLAVVLGSGIAGVAGSRVLLVALSIAVGVGLALALTLTPLAVFDLVATLTSAFLLAACGRLLRARLTRLHAAHESEARFAEQLEEVRRAERRRIAVEMNQVVGRGLDIIDEQTRYLDAADPGLHAHPVTPLPPAEQRETEQEIHRAAKQALADLRTLLIALREVDPPSSVQR